MTNIVSLTQRAAAWDAVFNLLKLRDPSFPMSQMTRGAGCGRDAALMMIQDLHELAHKAQAERKQAKMAEAERLGMKLRERKLEVKRLSRALRLQVLERRALQTRYDILLQKLANAQQALAQNRANQNYQEGYSEGLADGLREVEGQ